MFVDESRRSRIIEIMRKIRKRIDDETRDYEYYMRLADEMESLGLVSEAKIIRIIAEEERNHANLLVYLNADIKDRYIGEVRILEWMSGGGYHE